jgi:hypothetical protein
MFEASGEFRVMLGRLDGGNGGHADGLLAHVALRTPGTTNGA